LAIYLLLRILGHAEEGRYQTLRKQWGAAAERRLFFFYQIQALAAVFFALPILIVAHNPVDRLTAWDFAGVLIWVISVTNTVLADRQLARFKQRPESRGKTCRDGWWRYSRHPNYFFEWLHWWSYVPLAIGASYWWVTLLAPAAMLHFLLNVTGIPPAEAQAVATRGDDYRDYKRTTSAFIPWFTKDESSVSSAANTNPEQEESLPRNE
jgi:steroid 5-alpha reductase family enzyme